jgi:hypothetical protein
LRKRYLEEDEEEKLRGKWLNIRKEDKNKLPEDDTLAEDYSVGCELIPLKDLFIVILT